MRIAWQRFLLACVAGLLVAGTASACGGGSSRLYDANATFTCLQKRPEYRSPSFSWYPGEPGVTPPPAFAFTLLAPRPGFRNQANFPFKGSNVGPSWTFALTPVRGSAFAPARLVIFDQIDSAGATYRMAIRLADPALLAGARKENEVIHNVFLDWSTPDGPTKQVRALILGCLRSR